MVTRTAIEDLTTRIVQQFQPDRIILFGSYAYGTPTPDSDVDLLIVIPHQGKSWKMATEIRGRTWPGFPLDLIVRSAEQVQNRLAMGDTFIMEITEKGKV